MKQRAGQVFLTSDLIPHRNLFTGVLCALALALSLACGTDFVEPGAVGAQQDEETPAAEPTVYRVIEVTPQPTPTPIATAVGPGGAGQREFPSEIDPSRAGRGLPADAVIGFWSEYLGDARVIVEGKPIDVHICSDGSLIPGSPATIVARGTWGMRPSGGEWYEIIFGREFRAGRISGLITFSRIGQATVDKMDGLSVVSVTDSDLCGTLGGD